MSGRSVEAIKAYKLGVSKPKYTYLSIADMQSANLVAENFASVSGVDYQIVGSGSSFVDGQIILNNGNKANPITGNTKIGESKVRYIYQDLSDMQSGLKLGA